jgi:hypothetical protein
VEVFDGRAVRQAHAEEFAPGGIIVGGDPCPFRLPGQEAVGVVVIGRGSGGEQVVYYEI